MQLSRMIAPLLAGALFLVAPVNATAVAELHPAPLRSHPDTTGADAHLEGEYGLWVQRNEGRMEVRWITRTTSTGFLEVIVGDRMRDEFTTPISTLHSVEFPEPRARQVVLRYGSATDSLDRYQTTLYRSTDRRPTPSYRGVDSIFVVGDVHGQYDRLIRLLRNANVIDDELRWSAGRAHLVLLGDLMDRGPDATRTLWFLYGLERQAEQQRGRVHVVLGNHEIMVFLGDLRYVNPKEQLIASLHGTDYSGMFDVRHSVLGRWLASKPAMLRIDDVLFAHGGVTPDYLAYSVESYDDSLATFIGEDLFYRWNDSTAVIRIDSASLARRTDFFWGDNSVFWYRGYVRADTLDVPLGQVLDHFRSGLHVVAHTSVPTIQERYGGAVIAVQPDQPARELLLLVRSGDEHRRFRIGLTGPPAPLEPAAPRPAASSSPKTGT